MATAGLADIHNNSCWGHTMMRKNSWDHTDVQQLSPTEQQHGVEQEQGDTYLPFVCESKKAGAGRVIRTARRLSKIKRYWRGDSFLSTNWW